MTSKPAPIWWSNSIFFVSMHAVALLGAFRLSPWWALDQRTLLMCFVSWQLATYGITIGYHRLWSHRSFTATFPLRVSLALMGCLGFQGSIKWWVLRHRLHHRFTDTEDDPYNAQLGLYHSHMGWIFRKPDYPKMGLIERDDLNRDPVVRFQHKYYLPLTLGLGLVAPCLIGWTYGDALGGFIWGGVVARILIWHFTFFINSLAHYLGDQAYSEDVTARGNFFLALFTGGEANHNFHHAYPCDYRNGPRSLDWDPTKWIIYVLHAFTPFIPRIKQTSESDILKARSHVLALRASRSSECEDTVSPSTFAMWSSYASATSDDGAYSSDGGDFRFSKGSSGDDCTSDSSSSSSLPSRAFGRHSQRDGLPKWTKATLLNAMDAMQQNTKQKPCIVIVGAFAIDVTNYMSHHPGGSKLLREWSIKTTDESVRDATAAFYGGLNNHGWSAREKMKSLRIAQIVGPL